jgi:hypothetical protein
MTELFGGPRVTPQVADLSVGLTLKGVLPPASSKSNQYSCAHGDGERTVISTTSNNKRKRTPDSDNQKKTHLRQKIKRPNRNGAMSERKVPRHRKKSIDATETAAIDPHTGLLSSHRSPNPATPKCPALTAPCCSKQEPRRHRQHKGSVGPRRDRLFDGDGQRVSDATDVVHRLLAFFPGVI